MLHLREEAAADIDAILEANAAAFGGPAEGRLVDRLRRDNLIVASLVAVVDDRIVGNIVFSRLAVEGQIGSIDAVALAPMAVLPEYQRRGIGTALVREGLRACRQRGSKVVIVLGHPSYYSRFGFSSALAERLNGPYSGSAWMALELLDGVLHGFEGNVTYPAAFAEVEVPPQKQSLVCSRRPGKWCRKVH
jgi:putative acetyltransferase